MEKKPNKKVLEALVNKPELVAKEHKFQIFLEKPTDSDRHENINAVAEVVHRTHGNIVHNWMKGDKQCLH